MPEEKSPEPLDLSSFDHLTEAPAAPAVTAAPLATVTTPPTTLDLQIVPASDVRLAAPTAPAPRLVEIANLSAGDLAAAKASADKVDFR